MMSGVLWIVVFCLEELDQIDQSEGQGQGRVLKFGFGRDAQPHNLSVDPHKYLFFFRKKVTIILYTILTIELLPIWTNF